jgi:hypothetical protein
VVPQSGAKEEYCIGYFMTLYLYVKHRKYLKIEKNVKERVRSQN